MLDLGTCTECGRCQSQCPAWVTGKPLSPKQVILDLRDHAFAKAPYLLAAADEARDRLPEAVKAEAERPLVGTKDQHGVIDPDVLWSCTNCGACVEECPVDIEHIDHIDGMRRYQVLIESAFPQEAATMLSNLEPGPTRGGWPKTCALRLDHRARLRGPRRGRQDRRRRRVPVLGRLRRRARRPGQEDHPGHRRVAAHRRGEVRGPRGRWRHAPATPPAGWATSSCSPCSPSRTSRRSTTPGGRRIGQEDHRLVPALLQHHRPRVPPARRQLRGHPPHAAAGQLVEEGS